MKKRSVIMLGGVLLAGSGAIAVSGATAFATFANPAQEASAANDPRQEPPVVKLATAARVSGSERSFTGIIGRGWRAISASASPARSSSGW